ncbi:MAG: response regulator transcription factor [Pseudomonadota bacterium]
MDKRPSILITEDEDDLRIDIAEYFQHAGWRVETASCGRDAMLRINSGYIDIWLIDLRLPDIDGLELLEAARHQAQPAGTIVLTASLDDTDLVESLRLGCDNYLNKTASLEAVLAAATNLLQRMRGALGDGTAKWVLRGRELIDLHSGDRVRLTPSELCLLSMLGKTPNEAVDRASLLEALNRPNPSQGNLDVYISRLRRKLQEAFRQPPEIIPLYGTGYMLDCAIKQ